MQRTLLAVAALGLCLVGCGDDSGGDTAGDTSTVQTGTTADTPTTGDPGDDTTGSGPGSSSGEPGTTMDPGTSGDTTGADSSGTGEAAVASADISGLGDNQGMGSAVFTREGDDITLVLDLQNITPEGLHGTHIHEVGDCSAEDGTSAGGHWNPFGMQHGMLGMGESHLGDMGNAVVEANGDGLLTITTDQWTVGTGDDTDIIGRAIIVHEGEDDLSTMPSPGARIACGVIVAGG